MVPAIRATREVTTGGALPSLSMASTRASEARMSCSVGGAGSTKPDASRPSCPRTRSHHALTPTAPASSGGTSLRGQAGEVELAAGVAGVVCLDAVEVLLRLRHLVLQHPDRLRHRVQRLDLELVDRVHGRVDVRERGLELLHPDGRRRGLLLDRRGVLA